MKTHLSLTAILALSLLTTQAEEKTTLLKIKWPAGKKVTQVMEMNETTTMKLGDQEMDQTMAMTQQMIMSITADGENSKVESEYGRIKMSMNTMGQEMGYDSDKPDEASPMAAMGKMVGQKFGFTVTPDNEITEFSGIEEMLNAMAGEGEAANPMLSQMVNEEAMKQSIQQGMIQAMPDKPVAKGDQWPFEIQIPMPNIGDMSMKGTYTLKGWEDLDGVNCAVIEFDGKMNLEMEDGEAADGDDEAAKAMKAMGMEIKDGDSKGTYWFDNELGMARKAEMVQNMTMSMKNPQTGEGMDIPIKQDITVTLPKVEDL